MDLDRFLTETEAQLISGILNLVCPECGGSMGGANEEFKCKGRCRRDWREIWEEVLAPSLAESVDRRSRVNATGTSD